jgi:hypothetical protein
MGGRLYVFLLGGTLALVGLQRIRHLQLLLLALDLTLFNHQLYRILGLNSRLNLYSTTATITHGALNDCNAPTVTPYPSAGANIHPFFPMGIRFYSDGRSAYVCDINNHQILSV